MSIYTRTGDTGKTSLFGGVRVAKNNSAVAAYGSVDELNSWVGLIIAQLKTGSEQTFLKQVQADLFTIGSTLAGWKSDDHLKFIDRRVLKMEQLIDEWSGELPELKSFILPGGSPDGARVHIVRTVCRRIERELVSLSEKEPVDPEIIRYINRLSDLFFMLARFINKHAKVEETAWIGIPRKK